MGATTLNVWLRFFAWLWKTDWFGEGYRPANRLDDDALSEHLKRDLGFMEGRSRIGQGIERQSDELREALRQLPRPL